MIYCEQIYPARTISVTEAPDWLIDYRSVGPARFMDQVFNLVMCTSQLSEDIDNFMACSGKMEAIYADAIIHSKQGKKAAIKDATITNFHQLDVTLVGGIFVLADDLNALRSEQEKTMKKIEAIEKDQPDLARFRHILEE